MENMNERLFFLKSNIRIEANPLKVNEGRLGIIKRSCYLHIPIVKLEFLPSDVALVPNSDGFKK